MHSIARVSVQFVYFHLYVLCLVYDEYDNKAIIIIIIIIIIISNSALSGARSHGII